MQLLIETIDSSNLETIIEESEGKKNYYISGPMILAETKNRNGRIYPATLIEREVGKLQKLISINKCAGELSHPARPDIEPERISHYVTELRRDGNVWFGKAKIASTPMGTIVKGLLSDGYKLGISTRGLGTVGANGYVDESFRLICADLVDQPSTGLYMDSILESVRYKILEDGTITRDIEPAVELLESKIAKLPKQETQKYITEAIREFLRSI